MGWVGGGVDRPTGITRLSVPPLRMRTEAACLSRSLTAVLTLTIKVPNDCIDLEECAFSSPSPSASSSAAAAVDESHRHGV